MRPPVIILVRPQLGQNIGKAARAMLNFTLADLRLVAPRDGWPNPEAGPAAAGADDVLDRARIFDTVEDAVADLVMVWATSVRPRDMVKPVTTPEKALGEARSLAVKDQSTGFLFGPERSGLTNDDIALCDAILTIPVNPDFGSLNLAQAVVLVAYEWYRLEGEREVWKGDPPVPKGELDGLHRQILAELDAAGYFRTKARRPVMERTLRNLFSHARLTSQQVQTLRGVVKAIARGKPGK